MTTKFYVSLIFIICLFFLIYIFLFSMFRKDTSKRKPRHIQLLSAIILLVLNIPILINELYKSGENISKPYITMWDATATLSFYGSFLAFLGTVALGSLALWQNKKLQTLNETANEKIIINNIIDYERNRLISLNKAFQVYFEHINQLSDILKHLKNGDENKLYHPVDLLNTKLLFEQSFSELNTLICLDVYVKQNEDKIHILVNDLYKNAVKIFIDLIENNCKIEEKLVSVHFDKLTDLINEKEEYCFEQTKKLRTATYVDVTLTQIQNMYNRERISNNKNQGGNKK